MTAIQEEILKLPRDEKIELLHVLQEDIEKGEELKGQEVPAAIMHEIERRVAMADRGEVGWMNKAEFYNFLKEKRNAIYNSNH